MSFFRNFVSGFLLLGGILFLESQAFSENSRIHVAVLPHELKRTLREITALGGPEVDPALTVSAHLQSYQRLRDEGRWNWKNAKKIFKEFRYPAVVPLVGLVPKLLLTGHITSRDLRWAFLYESALYLGIQGTHFVLGRGPHKLKLVEAAKRREDRACQSLGFRSSDSLQQVLKALTLTEEDFRSQRVFINGHVLTPELAQQRGWLDSNEVFLVYSDPIQCRKQGSKLYSLDESLSRRRPNDLL